MSRMRQRTRLYDVRQEDDEWSELHHKVKAEELAGHLLPVGTYLSTQMQPTARSGISKGPRKDAQSSLSANFIGPEETIEDVLRERRNVLGIGLRGVNHSFFAMQDTGQHDSFERGQTKYAREGSHLDSSFLPNAKNQSFIGGLYFGKEGSTRGGKVPFQPPIAGGRLQHDIVEQREMAVNPHFGGASVVQVTSSRHLAGQVVHSTTNFEALQSAAPDFPLDYSKMPPPEKPRYPPPRLRNPYSLDPLPEEQPSAFSPVSDTRSRVMVPTGLSPVGGGGTHLKPKLQPRARARQRGKPPGALGSMSGIGALIPRPPAWIAPLARYPGQRDAQNGYGPIASQLTHHTGGNSHFVSKQGHGAYASARYG